jgi:hypothetical protein
MKSLAVALFVAIVALGLDRGVLQHSVPPRRPSAEMLARRADPNPDLALFLAGVQQRTARGDSIAVVLPELLDAQRDAYRFRAAYHLAGRNVVPLEDAASAQWVAAWRVPAEGRVAWADHHGVLVRQR